MDGSLQWQIQPGTHSKRRALVCRCQEIITDVAHTPPSAKVIQQMDDISDAVCQVHDAAEFCRNSHTSPAWRKAAQETCSALGGFVHELNQDTGLYHALVRAMEHHDRLASHSQASTSTADTSPSPAAVSAAQGDPEGEGYNREAVLVGRLLVRDFEKAGVHLEGAQRQATTDLKARIGQTGYDIMANIAGQAGGSASKPWLGNPHAMLFHENEAHRKRGYDMLMASPADNEALMQRLAEDRSQLAGILGVQSYAEYTLDAATLAGSPAAVASFLQALNDSIQPQLEEELQDLAKLKAREVGSGSAAVQAWDRGYLQRKAKAAVGDGSSSGTREHFRFESVIKGLREILKRIFGVDMQDVPLEPGESWAENVFKYAFSHPDAGPLGEVYIDPIARPHKFAGCAHFTLRCKKRLASGEHQQPLVALLLNLGSPFMSPSETRTLFHEFGHVLHSILSRAEFQHLAGTRGPLDMVEIPSHFFEHFLLDDDCLGMCSRHFSTGEPMPPAMRLAVRRSLDFMPALEMNDSIVDAMVDQRFHGRGIKGHSLGSTLSEVVQQYSAFHPPVESHRQQHLRFGHLVTYGSSYYAYVYARFIADAIWQQSFAQDPLSREAGMHIWDKLLSLGGSKKPKAMVEDLLGPGSLQAIGGGWAPAVDCIQGGSSGLDGSRSIVL